MTSTGALNGQPAQGISVLNDTLLAIQLRALPLPFTTSPMPVWIGKGNLLGIAAFVLDRTAQKYRKPLEMLAPGKVRRWPDFLCLISYFLSKMGWNSTSSIYLILGKVHLKPWASSLVSGASPILMGPNTSFDFCLYFWVIKRYCLATSRPCPIRASY